MTIYTLQLLYRQAVNELNTVPASEQVRASYLRELAAHYQYQLRQFELSLSFYR